MSDFDLLLQLTRAAETCNANARDFIQTYSEVPDFSTDGWAAGQQVSQHLDQAAKFLVRLDGYRRQWEAAVYALDWVGMAVGLARPEIHLDGRSYQTAHEAAYYLAEAVRNRFDNAEGFDDFEVCADLADKLNDLTTTPDLYGRIKGEHFAAASLIPFDDLETDNQTTRNEKRCGTAQTKWALANTMLDAEQTNVDDWDYDEKRAFVRRYAAEHSEKPNYTALTVEKLGELIRDRRKRRDRLAKKRRE